jgi:hypothetical protein
VPGCVGCQANLGVIGGSYESNSSSSILSASCKGFVLAVHIGFTFLAVCRLVHRFFQSFEKIPIENIGAWLHSLLAIRDIMRHIVFSGYNSNHQHWNAYAHYTESLHSQNKLRHLSQNGYGLQAKSEAMLRCFQWGFFQRIEKNGEQACILQGM